MMENTRCRRWVTTNQDEFQSPVSKKIDGYVTSEEFGRYEDCMKVKACQEEMEKEMAREAICCGEQNENREPTYFPTDSHIDPELKATKAPWCRCLATGDPNLYEENREQAKTDDMCYCRMCYKQTDVAPVDNPRAKIYSSTNFIDFRDPTFPFIENKMAMRKVLDEKFKVVKAENEAIAAKKEPKLAPLPQDDFEDTVQPNCIGNYPCLPPAKTKKPWKEDQSWFRNPSSDCVKNLLKKYIYTSTYREMNKDGAALPLVVREIPKSCIEKPPGDPVREKPELAPCTVVYLGDVFEKWDRPQVRSMAQRCDTITNNPCLDKCCLDKDAYFQEQFLNRGKFAQCVNPYSPPSEENYRLAKENRLRQPYDKMIPYYGGYDALEAPSICKVKKVFNPFDPYSMMSMYQADFINHPKEMYENPVLPYRPDDLDKRGISTNPVNTLVKKPLPDAQRLSCYMECKRSPCQADEDGTMSAYIECKKIPCKPPPARNFGQPNKEDLNPGQRVQVVIPASLKAGGGDSTYDIDIPREYGDCPNRPKEDLMQIGTYVVTPQQVHLKSGNLTLAKKKELKGCA